MNHKESRLDGKLLIRNFENPELKFSGTINAQAEDLIEFYPIDTISSVSGGIKLKTNIEGNLESIKKNFFDSKINLVGEFFDLKMKFKKSITEAGVKSGKIVLDEKLLSAENIKINLKDQELNLSGKAENYTRIFARSNEPLKINADIQSDFLNYDQLAGLLNKSEGKTKKENVKIISEDVEVIIDLKIKKLKLFNHDLESLTGRLQTKESKVLLENVEFESCGGRVKINSIIEETKDKLSIKGITQIRDINIYEAFKEYKGFGQSTLTHENIKGIANTSVDFSFETDQSFNLISKSLMSSCNITIENGELIRFKPLEGLGRYIEINELKHVKFSKLKSHVDIMDEKFIIEKTQIDNSAINISLSGSHSFRQDIEYKISLLLSEFLAKKPRKKKELDEELKYVEEDSENKRKVFLLVYGNIDDIKFKYDRKSAKEKVKEDFKNEKQNLKEILNEEFGFFKKDTIKIKKKKERSNEDESLQFEWDNKKQKNNDDDDKDF
ncbi:MAG: AsmA-like C-terminal region-containing protein [Bacteroidota bacterium]